MQMEAHRTINDAYEIKKTIQKGYDAIETALHYQIPYPRLHYMDYTETPLEMKLKNSPTKQHDNHTEKLKRRKAFSFPKPGNNRSWP